MALPVAAQDAAVALALLLPGLLAGGLVLRGFAPWPLVRALLRRHRGAALTFVALIAVSVALGVGLVAQERALREGSARAAAPFDVILGAPGSELTLTLAAVYLQPADVPLLTGALMAEVAADPEVELAAPIAFGDSAGGDPVVGTIAPLLDRLGGLAEGRAFAAHEEAVVGALSPWGLGDRIEPAHGQGEGAEAHAHGDLGYAVVGRLAPTGSPWDRAVLVPIESVWEVHGLPTGHPPGSEALGPPFDAAAMPGVPALLVVPRELWGAYALKTRYTRPDLMAVFPGTVVAQVHGLLREVREAMSLMALLTQGLVAASVLTGLALLVRLFARGLALLRALGAPRRFVLAVVWGFAAALLAAGALLGLALGWLAAAVLSRLVTARTGVLVEAEVGWAEAQLVAAFASLALLLALAPALLASRRPPLRDLRA